MKVKVTAKHIAKGLSGSTQYCPVALALKEKGFENAFVFETYAVVKGAYHYFRRGTKFIKDFDEGKKVKPCTIELEFGS